MDDPTPTAERTVEYAIAALGRRRFLQALAAICDTRAVSWDWDLVGVPGIRKLELTFRGLLAALDAVEREVATWRETERSYWSGTIGGGPA